MFSIRSWMMGRVPCTTSFPLKTLAGKRDSRQFASTTRTLVIWSGNTYNYRKVWKASSREATSRDLCKKIWVSNSLLVALTNDGDTLLGKQTKCVVLNILEKWTAWEAPTHLWRNMSERSIPPAILRSVSRVEDHLLAWDLEGGWSPIDDIVNINTDIGNSEVTRILVDTGSSCNIPSPSSTYLSKANGDR